MAAVRPFMTGTLQERYDDFQKVSVLEDQALMDYLKDVSAEDIDPLVRFAIEEVTDLQFPEGDSKYQRFITAFRSACAFSKFEGQVPYGLSQKSHDEIFDLFVKRGGIPHDLLRFDDICERFKASLTQFLGDKAQIDEIDSLEKAKDVAFVFFAGPRNLPESPFSRCLARLIRVGEEGDLDRIKQLMHRLRQAQEKTLTREGFLFRQKKFLEKEVAVTNQVECKVFCIGRRTFDLIKTGESDGSYFNGKQVPGIPISPDKEDLSVARARVEQHFDDPILVKGDIDQAYIEKGEVPSIAYRVLEKIPEGALCPAEGINREDLLREIDRLFQEEVPPPPFPQRDPPPRPDLRRPADQPAGWGLKPRKLVHAGIVVIVGLLFYKYVGNPLYTKGKEWWDARPKATS